MTRILIASILLCTGQALAQCDSGNFFHSYQIEEQLDAYSVYDTPGATSGPSNWFINVNGRLRETSNIYHGIYPDWGGSSLLLETDCWQDFELSVVVNPNDNDQWGILFGADSTFDVASGYRVIFSNDLHQGAFLQAAEDTAWTTVDSVTTHSYSQGIDQELLLRVEGQNVLISLDESVLFDAELAGYAPGHIGYWVRAMNSISFDNLFVTPSLDSNADAFADSVVSANINQGNVGNIQDDPLAALGAPDGWYLSMGGYCSANPDSSTLILDMGPDQESITDGPGVDFEVLEIGSVSGGVDEPFEVYVAQSPGGPWAYLGTGSGDSFFDLAGSGFCEARYVRLVDLSTATCNTASQVPGSDIEALIAFYPGLIEIPDPVLEITIVDDMVQLDWNELDCVTGYRVERAAATEAVGYAWATMSEQVDTGYSEVLPADRSGYIYRVIALTEALP